LDGDKYTKYKSKKFIKIQALLIITMESGTDIMYDGDETT